ncbi:hypothetical protein BSKO_04990 [Bryopsis sp. KO-2023]|nr:hypothetical protein BSKO_04990 [Bryopsis sp. KO-2023]
MRTSTGCARLLLACVVVAVFWGSASARCTCSDVQPRVAHDGPPLEEGCIEQRSFGKCEADFMFNTIVELEAGYCQITCGRCDCCSTVEELALNLGLVELVTALQIAGMAEDFLTNPGWMTSILAPQEGTLSSWLEQKGWTWASVEAEASQRDEMERMLSLHVLPPVQPMDSVWTTPFFLEGVVVPSLSQDHPLVAGRNPTTGQATLSGPVNTVTVLEGDKEFCKGFIHIVDNLLVLEVPRPAQPITSTEAINKTQFPVIGTAASSPAVETVILHEDTPTALQTPGAESITPERERFGSGPKAFSQLDEVEPDNGQRSNATEGVGAQPPSVESAKGGPVDGQLDNGKSSEPSPEASIDTEGAGVQSPAVESDKGGPVDSQPENAQSNANGSGGGPRKLGKGRPKEKSAGVSGTGPAPRGPDDSKKGGAQSQSDSGAGSGGEAGNKKKSSPAEGAGAAESKKKAATGNGGGSKNSQQDDLSDVEAVNSSKKDSANKSDGHLG